MSDEIKFTEEELKSLGDLQQSYQRITNSYGQIVVNHQEISVLLL